MARGGGGAGRPARALAELTRGSAPHPRGWPRCPRGLGAGPAEAEPGTRVGVQAWATPGGAEPAITRPRGGLGLTSLALRPSAGAIGARWARGQTPPRPVSHPLRARRPRQRLADPTGHRRHLIGTLQRPSQTQTRTDVPADTRKAYPSLSKGPRSRRDAALAGDLTRPR